MKKLCYASVIFCSIIVAGCMSGSNDDGGESQQQTDTGGGTPNNSPGGTNGTGGTDGSGGSSGGSTDGGTTGGGSTDGGSSGGSATVYGSFASLYTGSGVDLNILNCSLPPSVVFSSAVFRLVNQTDNNVDAAITLTPHQAFASQFNQTFITVNGAFKSDGSFGGNITSVFSLDGNVVASSQGTVTITVDDVASTISLDFVPDTNQTTCNLSGGFFLSKIADTGGGDTGGGSTGGGSSGGGTGGGDTGGGSSGGGTGGDTGGGVSTSAPGGTILIAYGQFGTLQVQSTAFPADNGTYEMTTVQYTNSAGFETFSWASTQSATVNIYPSLNDGSGGTFSNTTFNSINDRSYACRCIPTIDLIANEVIFSNLVLTATKTPTATITINGVVSYP